MSEVPALTGLLADHPRKRDFLCALPLVAGLLIVAVISVPGIALAATAHADADDPAHVNPDCDACHKPHQAPTKRSLLSGVTESEVCYVCHGDSGGSDWNVETWTANSFAGSMQSGHVLEDVTDPATTVDLTNSCTGCHGVHGDPDLRANLPANEQVAGATIDPADPKSWCLACHNADHAWYSGTETGGVFSINTTRKNAYEALIQAPTRNASYYPTLGTFPGSTGNAAYLASTHATGIDAGTVQSLVAVPTETVTRVQGDCLWCHASHRSAATYDGLLGQYRATTAADAAGGATAGQYAQACFECHGNSTGTVYLPASDYEDADWLAKGAKDIYSLVSDSSNPTRTGHQVRSSGAYYAVGSPLPCYECHNPHGSKNGNTTMISDALGGNLNPRGTAAQVRQFCFSCHTTGDLGKGWDWDAATPGYTADLAATAVGTKVIGIDRKAAPPTSYLRLSNKPYHNEGDSTSCLACHDSTHNPGPGVSKGGKDCYLCHSAYQSPMEDDSGIKQGATNADSYHHVVGGTVASTYYDGDKAFAAGSYPVMPGTTASEVFCLSCHVDHDKFNASKGTNLRSNMTAVNPTAASVDYDSTTNGGVCTDCHATSLTKEGMGTEQKADGSTATPKIVAGASSGQFGASAHDYYVSSSYGTSEFRANCSKCHDDGQTKEFQTSPFKFGTHWSLVRRILSPLGKTPTDPLQEKHCYGCHSEKDDGWKLTDGKDYYNVTTMTLAAEDVYDQFQLGGSKHPVEATANGSVECESCHNAHVVTSTTGKVTDPDNTYSVLAYGTTAQQATYCLRCHDGSLPSRTVNGTTYIPYSVTIAAGDATIMNKNTYAAGGHWTINGAIDSSEVKSCAVCHDNHGSVAPKLLGVRTATANTINGASITANDTTVCRACHTAASTGFPYFTKDATDYPNTGTWPSWATYSNGTYGIHRALDPGTGVGSSLPDYAAGDCKICHDVHGTSNPYDGLRPVTGDATPSVSGSYVTRDFSLCFDCHDSTGPATDNIAQYYPLSSGGTASSTTRRYGHKTVEAGTLPAGASLPCWDCHNPHGSSNTYGLQIITQTSSSNTISVTNFSTTPGTAYSSSSAAQVRAMCFTCHIPADTSNGWNGSAYAAVSAGARFEGLDRLTQLKISSRMPHNQGNAQNCIGVCHANVHYPE